MLYINKELADTGKTHVSVLINGEPEHFDIELNRHGEADTARYWGKSEEPAVEGVKVGESFIGIRQLEIGFRWALDDDPGVINDEATKGWEDGNWYISPLRLNEKTGQLTVMIYNDIESWKGNFDYTWAGILDLSTYDTNQVPNEIVKKLHKYLPYSDKGSEGYEIKRQETSLIEIEPSMTDSDLEKYVKQLDTAKLFQDDELIEELTHIVEANAHKLYMKVVTDEIPKIVGFYQEPRLEDWTEASYEGCQTFEIDLGEYDLVSPMNLAFNAGTARIKNVMEFIRRLQATHNFSMKKAIRYLFLRIQMERLDTCAYPLELKLDELVELMDGTRGDFIDYLVNSGCYVILDYDDIKERLSDLLIQLIGNSTIMVDSDFFRDLVIPSEKPSYDADYESERHAQAVIEVNLPDKSATTDLRISLDVQYRDSDSSVRIKVYWYPHDRLSHLTYIDEVRNVQTFYTRMGDEEKVAVDLKKYCEEVIDFYVEHRDEFTLKNYYESGIV